MSIPFLARSWQKKPRLLSGGIAMTTAQAEEMVNHPLEATAAWLSDVAGDPVAFVEGAFPWGDGELANFDGRALISLEPTNRLGALTAAVEPEQTGGLAGPMPVGAFSRSSTRRARPARLQPAQSLESATDARTLAAATRQRMQ